MLDCAHYKFCSTKSFDPLLNVCHTDTEFDSMSMSAVPEFHFTISPILSAPQPYINWGHKYPDPGLNFQLNPSVTSIL